MVEYLTLLPDVVDVKVHLAQGLVFAQVVVENLDFDSARRCLINVVFRVELPFWIKVVVDGFRPDLITAQSNLYERIRFSNHILIFQISGFVNTYVENITGTTFSVIIIFFLFRSVFRLLLSFFSALLL